MLVIAACFTSFYSWRLMFMTFYGKPRASHEVMHHVHESPMVMLLPLFILGIGAVAAGMVFARLFLSATNMPSSGRVRSFTSSENELLEHFHARCRALGCARAHSSR